MPPVHSDDILIQPMESLIGEQQEIELLFRPPGQVVAAEQQDPVGNDFDSAFDIGVVIEITVGKNVERRGIFFNDPFIFHKDFPFDDQDGIKSGEPVNGKKEFSAEETKKFFPAFQDNIPVGFQAVGGIKIIRCVVERIEIAKDDARLVLPDGIDHPLDRIFTVDVVVGEKPDILAFGIVSHFDQVSFRPDIFVVPVIPDVAVFFLVLFYQTGSPVRAGVIGDDDLDLGVNIPVFKLFDDAVQTGLEITLPVIGRDAQAD